MFWYIRTGNRVSWTNVFPAKKIGGQAKQDRMCENDRFIQENVILSPVLWDEESPNPLFLYPLEAYNIASVE